jgi:chemotaxis protein MotB
MDEESGPRTLSHEANIPRWMPTFADIMTLLMCFFVLLLTFAEMDVRRYKQIASSMAEAFGGQRPVDGEAVPMGNSVVAPDFAPGVTRPTPIGEPWQGAAPPVQEAPRDVDLTEQMKQNLRALVARTQADAADLAGQLQQEISRDEVEIETRGRTIVLRIREKGSFSSGSTELQPAYRELMARLAASLAAKPGSLMIRGHTDDVPIATARFRSNWELSSARAVSVAHELLRPGILDPRRLSITGYADTRPLVPNDSAENRERNRRVELVINQGIDQKTREQLEVLKSTDPEYYRKLGLDEQFNLSPEEVF